MRGPARLPGASAPNPAHLAAPGSTLDVLPATARGKARAQLQQAAIDFECASRSRVRADHHHARALRAAARELLHTPSNQDGAGLAMLLDAAVLARTAAARRHAMRHHAQQEAAARQALHQTQAACQHAAKQPLERLRQHAPPQETAERYAHHLRQTVPEHAEQVMADSSWSALTAVVAIAEQAGHNPAQLLQQAARQRPR